VISGEVEAVRRAGELAQAGGAKRVLPLNVSGAFHSPLMEEPSRRFAEALDAETFSLGAYPVYANVSAEPAVDAERWPRILEEQLRAPVRWTETVRNMIRDGIDTFVECGSGEVLSGLIRRIDKEARTFGVSDPATLRAASQGLVPQTT
jgi:[acyl-carrier-protein] S-malonyltransferase